MYLGHASVIIKRRISNTGYLKYHLYAEFVNDQDYLMVSQGKGVRDPLPKSSLKFPYNRCVLEKVQGLIYFLG
jgi:hypothetical protein